MASRTCGSMNGTVTMFRFLVLLGFTALVVSSGRAEEVQTVDLILVAGQSNAVGFDTNPADLPANTGDREVMFWWRCGDPPPDESDSTSGSREWSHLGPQGKGRPQAKDLAGRQYGNFSNPAGGFGPEIGLARTLIKRQPETRLAIIKVAFSGTGISRDWNPKDPEGKSGACFRALVTELRKAISAAKDKGIQLRPRAMIWVQGESDANAADLPRYADTLKELIGSLRRELESPELKVLTSLNTRFSYGENRLVEKVAEAQAAVATADSNCVFVDTSRASTANKYHFDSKGTLEVGVWFAEALLALESAR